MAAVSMYCRDIDGSSVATVPEVRVEFSWFGTATQPAQCSRIAALNMIWVVILVLLVLFLGFVDTRRPDNYPPGDREVRVRILVGGYYSVPSKCLTISLVSQVVYLLEEDITRYLANSWNCYVRVSPGPSWLPLVGNYPLLRRELARLKYHYQVWAHLGARYGPVVGLRLGRDLVVLVSGYTAIRAVLTREEFEGRPDGFFFKLRTFGQRLGLVFTDGPLWQEQRRFSLVHLRNLGLGKSSMEAQIQAEAEELVVSLRDKGSDNRPVVMHDAFDICVLNSLWALLAGHRFALNDKRLAELIDIVHASFRMLDMSGGLLNQMPFLRFLAPDKSGYTRIINILERMFNFLRETITEHRTTLNPDFSRDLIDSFLVEIDKQPDSTFSGECQVNLPPLTTCAQPNMASQ
uniref:Cytochrome P450 n=1 Tax=Timema tahoe TaxID=61484 RepID=A0A7R9FI98_9NEOP|nr:unnamed protein product [Timema tahoe]